MVPVGWPAPGTAICRLSDLALTGAWGAVFGEGTARLEVFLVRDGTAVRGYVNACPHAGTPLDTFAHRFLSQDGTRIVCTTHGARFRLEDGVCVAGPCLGQALRPFAVVITQGSVCVA